MRKLINIAFALLLFTSCSSAWHLNRAIKKNPEIAKTKVDTLTIITPAVSKIVYAKDSIIINEPGVYISVKTKNDSLVLFYEFLTDTVRIIEKQIVYNAPKTRQEKRLEAKTERVEIRNTERSKRVESRTHRKEKKFEYKSKGIFLKTAFTLIIGVIIGFVACLFLVKRFTISS
jgi:hypothetical protein